LTKNLAVRAGAKKSQEPRTSYTGEEFHQGYANINNIIGILAIIDIIEIISLMSII
jgi:hypothetical protein